MTTNPIRAAILAALLPFALAAEAEAASFTLTSSTLPAGASFAPRNILKGFGCTGGNVSPALAWSGAPEGTKSFAVTLYDPDAPTGSGWWHWVVFNLPPTVTSLPEGAGNKATTQNGGIEGRTDFGTAGYGGPCPPVGDAPHRYVFTVHALKVATLPLDANAPAAMVGYMIGQNSLGKASFTAAYGR